MSPSLQHTGCPADMGSGTCGGAGTRAKMCPATPKAGRAPDPEPPTAIPPPGGLCVCVWGVEMPCASPQIGTKLHAPKPHQLPLSSAPLEPDFWGAMGPRHGQEAPCPSPWLRTGVVGGCLSCRVGVGTPGTYLAVPAPRPPAGARSHRGSPVPVSSKADYAPALRLSPFPSAPPTRPRCLARPPPGWGEQIAAPSIPTSGEHLSPESLGEATPDPAAS